MNRRIVAELPGWGVLASVTAGTVPGWKQLDEQALKQAAAATMVSQGLLSIEEAGVAQIRIQPPPGH